MTKIDKSIGRQHRATLPRHARVRVGKREVTDPSEAWAVIDEARIAHVGFIADARPMVIPMLHARIGRKLYIHGAKATRIVKGIEERAPVCLTVTLLDGIVVARSAFHHSMNYRSVVVHAQARHVVNAAEKEAALVALTNRLLPGRWDEVRPMTAKEFGATGVLALDVEQITMKRRDGPPVDDEEDYRLPVWAGVVSLAEIVTGVSPDERLEGDIPASPSVAALALPGR
ncbi:pyridoxamine 5'-phosphate oxidase family protein [Stappia sp.]|jgi:nitroimidazol reductase NimA-like FMN-containing flavoprotein (pyridoxamine 5'-phosphate oxidase superfamily)|uniref:pyridoxamine 5'-phosphate oxidase family protein n=1 Tax=Stappia sp. TaxID=1870903 RepID=UPI003D0A7827